MKTRAIIILLLGTLVMSTLNFVNSKDEFAIAQLGGQANYEKLMDFFNTDAYKAYQTQTIDNTIKQATTPAQ